MKEVSNKTLVILLCVAMLITILGTFSSLSRLGFTPSDLITGAATTGTGKVNITISRLASITINDSTIEFGNGTLDTCPTTFVAANNSNNPSTFNDAAAISMFSIENSGNDDVNISMNGTAVANWLGGTGSAYKASAVVATGDDGCQTETLSYITVGAAFQQICANLTFGDAADRVNVTVALEVGCDLAPKDYSDNSVNFLATPSY